MSESENIQEKLFKAMVDDQYEEVERLLEENADVEFDKPRKDGCCLIMSAVANGYEKSCLLFLKFGAEVNFWSTNSGNYLIHTAVKNHNYIIAKVLLKKNANVDARNIEKNAAIHIAVQNGIKSICELLIKFKANLNLSNKNGDYPLHIAVKANNYLISKLLLKNNADVDRTTKGGMTPIHIAVKNKNTSMCDLLVKFRPNLNFLNQSGDSPLLISVKENNCEISEILLQNDTDIDLADEDGNTAIHIAVKDGNKKMCELLLKFAANTNISNEFGEWPLLTSAMLDNLMIAELLLKNNAKVNKKTEDGVDLIYTSAMNGNESLFSLLLKYGAQIDTEMNIKNQTILHLAVKNKSLFMLEYILKYCRVKVKNFTNLLEVAILTNYNTYIPFLECIIKSRTSENISKNYCKKVRNHFSIVNLLINHGFRVSTEAVENEKIVTFVIVHGYVELFEELLNNGLDVNLFLETYSCSILHIAVKCGHESIVKILLNRGATTNNLDSTMKPSLFYAIIKSDVQIVRLILQNSDVDAHSKLFNLAVWIGNVDIVTAFFQYGFNLDGQEKSALYYTINKEDLSCGDHVLQECSDHAKGEMAKLLLRHMKDIKPNLIHDVLLAAVKNTNQRVVEAILPHRTNFHHVYKNALPQIEEKSQSNLFTLRNLPNSYYNILHAASGNVRAAKIVEELIRSGFCVDCQNENCATPLHIAISQLHTDIAEVLLKNGASSTCEDKNGASPLLLSIDTQQVELFQLILEYSFGSHIETTNKGTLFDYIQKRNIESFVRDEANSATEKLTTILQHHVAKLKIGNLPVEEALFLSIPFTSDVDDKCQAEIATSKADYVGNTSITYYDILSKNLTYLKEKSDNASFQTVIAAGAWKEKYPFYQDLINSKIAKIEKRRKLLETFEPFLSVSFPILSPHKLCLEKIMSYVTNDELASLVCAFLT